MTNSLPSYGGGIDDGAQLGKPSAHGQILVGHEREDGLEFWLLAWAQLGVRVATTGLAKEPN